MIASLGMFLVVLVGPLVFYLVYKVRKANRMTGQGERDRLPFKPVDEAAPGWFLRRFDAQERVYLKQQLGLFKGGLIFLTWSFTLLFCFPALQSIPRLTRAWINPAALTWYMYLDGASGTIVRMSGTFCFFSAFIAVLPLRIGGEAQFYRTRPLSLGFLFWGRMLPLIGLIISATITALALSLAAVYLVKGPVWQHLPPSFPGLITQDDDRRDIYAALLATSAPRIFLSVVTSFAMIFSFSVAIASAPVKGASRKESTGHVVLVSMMLGIVATGVLSAMRAESVEFPRVLFLYTQLGPAPPYGLVLVPIVLSAGALLLARFFTSRLEI